MKAGIITIGDELLIGETIDTNSAWMAKALDNIGVEVEQILTISDGEEMIRTEASKFLDLYDLVLLTGGLGPTHDDITKVVLASMFGQELVFDREVFEDVSSLMTRLGREVNELNRQQAMVPSGCKVIRNDRGTAPGMIFEKGTKKLISMPGVPHEMKSMMERKVLPMMAESIGGPAIHHRHIKTFGIGESDLFPKLEKVIKNLDHRVKLAFLPSVGHVKIRLSLRGLTKIEADQVMKMEEGVILDQISEYVYGFDADTLEVVIGNQLRKLGLTLATAESCTGGSLAGRITSVPGSSDYFLGSVVAYDNEVKRNLLKVSEKDLDDYGAVSEQVVLQMAKGIRQLMGADVGLSTSGIAGPDGGTDEKPVGTIWIGISSEGGDRAIKLQLGRNRKLNITLTVDHLLFQLVKELNKKLD